jgi:hypothetical protein
MLRFKQYVPYRINRKLLGELNLEPDKNAKPGVANKSPISIMDFLHRILNNKFEFTAHSSFVFEMNVTTGAELYSFDPVINDSTKILKIILNMAKETKDLGEVLNYAWYFIEEERLVEDTHLYYHFFLCQGDEIIDQMVTISDGPPFSFPQTFLLEDTEVYLSNDAENRAALSQICYEKWQHETLEGRIFAKRALMGLGEDLEQEGKNLINKPYILSILFALIVFGGDYFLDISEKSIIAAGFVFVILFMGVIAEILNKNREL